ncbi:hypothetical protein [Bradyrhizobium liaoningense]|uniref:hypothetical protein n=1 Tax=Bradyrhizobium liaoningense TaxID=43992 RepID=UPI0012FE4745|nr:hypothetical protein [Bradyrhizobium liaoningense]
MTTHTIAPHRHRPRLWRDRDAWSEHEVRPCGVRGSLEWIQWRNRDGLGIDRAPDISDVLVGRPRRHLLVLWEPVLTKAPGPHLAQAHCCYINTVIFYHRPYVVRPWKHYWYDRAGKLRASGSGFFEWDQLETRFTCWDDRVSFRGDVFEVGGGRVLWANVPGERRQWWVRLAARRIRQEQP